MLALFAQGAAAAPQPMGWPDAAVAITCMVVSGIAVALLLYFMHKDFS